MQPALPPLRDPSLCMLETRISGLNQFYAVVPRSAILRRACLEVVDVANGRVAAGGEDTRSGRTSKDCVGGRSWVGHLLHTCATWREGRERGGGWGGVPSAKDQVVCATTQHKRTKKQRHNRRPVQGGMRSLVKSKKPVQKRNAKRSVGRIKAG